MIKQEIDESFICKFTKLKNSIENLKQNRKPKKSGKRKMNKTYTKEDILQKTYSIPEKFNNNLIKKQQLAILNEKSKLESQRIQNEFKKNLYEDKLNKLRKEENKFEVNKKNWLKNQFYQDELFFKENSDEKEDKIEQDNSISEIYIQSTRSVSSEDLTSECSEISEHCPKTPENPDNSDSDTDDSFCSNATYSIGNIPQNLNNSKLDSLASRISQLSYNTEKYETKPSNGNNSKIKY